MFKGLFGAGSDLTSVTDVSAVNRPGCEPLEKRTLLAAITGVLFNDVNGSRVRETGEEALAGWTVFLDQNKNRRLDEGEISTVTNQHGAYAFEGLAPGTYWVGSVLQEGWGQTSPAGGGMKNSRFNIDIRFVDRNLTESQKNLFRQAAQRWEQIIIGDLLDVFDPELGWIDDIVIDASAPFIDGVSGILGQATFTHQRPFIPDPNDPFGGSSDPNSWLPYRGFMMFDKADVAQMEAEGGLYDVILHEMAHVLGFSRTMWSQIGLVDDLGRFFPYLQPGQNPIYIGQRALAEYNAMFNLRDIGIAVEDTGGGGTALSHWRERVLDNELMTGFYNADSITGNPISRVTVAQFADIGYEVNMGAADVYIPPGSGVVNRTPSPNFENDPEFPLPEPFVGSRIQLASPPRNLLPYSHMVTIVESGEIIRERDFGVKENQAPQIRTLSDSPDPAPLGSLITLDAKGVHDPDGRVLAVTFWRESNGIAGLQTGAGGDTYISTKIPEQGFKAQTGTSGLLPGRYRFYARAIDELGHATTVSTISTVINPQSLPERPTNVVVTQQSYNALTIAWNDRSNNELGFLVQRSTDPDFSRDVVSWRLPPDTTSFTDTGLPSTTQFWYRVRAFNTAGSSAFARTVGGTFTLSPGDIIIDSDSASVTGAWAEVEDATAFGGAYLSDNNTGKGSKSVTYTADIPATGTYMVFARWVPGSDRASNVPIEITYNNGRVHAATVDQRTRGSGGAWVSLGTFSFNKGGPASIRISTAGTDGIVVADAVRFQATFPITQAQRAAHVALSTPPLSASLFASKNADEKDVLDLA